MDLKDIVLLGQRGAHLVRQILDFSRKSASMQQSLSLGPYLKEMLRFWRKTLPESIDLVVDLEPGDHIVIADSSQVQQALTNLVLNARDAMPDGGTLAVRLFREGFAAGTEAPFPDMAEGDWVAITVSDSGAGMSPEVRAHLFEPFFTTKSVGRGTGLGLAQAYGIVTQHNGHISVDSEEGRGTEITIHLPTASPIDEISSEGAGISRALGEQRCRSAHRV